jgi:hypothetical protein
MKLQYSTLIAVSITLLSTTSAHANWPSWIAAPNEEVTVRSAKEDERMSIMPIDPMNAVKYSYEYNGELPEYDSEVTVYTKKPTGMIDTTILESLLRSNNDSISLTSLANPKITGITVTSTTNDGETSVNISPEAISLSSYLFETCNENCSVENTENMKKIAEQYIKDMKISTTGLGEMIVKTESYGDGAYKYTDHTIFLPQQLNNKNVYNYNNPNGITLFSFNGKSITAATIPTVQYEYAGKKSTDNTSIIEKFLAAKREYWLDGNKGKTDYVLTLDEPTLEYSEVTFYENDTVETTIVPAFVFPIKDKDGLDLYNDTLIVPLVHTAKVLEQETIVPWPIEAK